MTAQATTPQLLRRVTADDLDQLTDLNRDAFRVDTPAQMWLRDGWVLDDERGIAGAILIELAGQHFGGAAVEAAIMDAVSVRADLRGRGTGRGIVLATLDALRERGVVVCSASPSTLDFYRRLGWEASGVRNVYAARLTDLPRLPSHDRVESWDDDDLEAVDRCYRAFAAEANGLVDRSLRWWRERILPADDGGQPLRRWLVRRDGEVRGYLVYRQRPQPAAMPFYAIACQELVWLDAGAAAALLAFLAGQRGLGVEVEWPGPVDEPLLQWFEQQALLVRHAVPWICRLVDAPAALARRGYPSGLETAVELELLDEQLPANAGALRLEVSGGCAAVTPLRSARMQVDVRTLAPLWSGWLDPRAAVRCGGLHGAERDDLDRLAAIFGGPKPWIAEVL